MSLEGGVESGWEGLSLPLIPAQAVTVFVLHDGRRSIAERDCIRIGIVVAGPTFGNVERRRQRILSGRRRQRLSGPSRPVLELRFVNIARLGELLHVLVRSSRLRANRQRLGRTCSKQHLRRAATCTHRWRRSLRSLNSRSGRRADDGRRRRRRSVAYLLLLEISSRSRRRWRRWQNR